MDWEWSVFSVWQRLGVLGRPLALLLLMMAIHAALLLLLRILRLGVLRWNSKSLLRSLRGGACTIPTLLSSALNLRESHVAPVVIAGISAFQDAPGGLSFYSRYRVADGAMRRCESRVHAD